ncbi:MAG TPA: SDR family oxidoreductase [Candidatus Polarisedimenticolaceae bacterium]|nr:SDR family oxidoreductase [Candidatus Polarisedimenticolaceae bacterium]
MSLLAGRCLLVTGASGGIGAAVARLAREEGAQVAAADLPGRPAPEGTIALTADLANPAGAAALFSAYDAQLPRLDALVHCAGIVRDGVLWKLSDEAWSDVLRTNLDAAFWVLREAAPRLRREGGAVVLLTSINGERGKLGQANYAASKAGLIGLGRTAARELGRFGVRVNLIAPGLIDTPMTASLPAEARQRAVEESVLGRAGTPEDVAHAALFLLSDRARHITGQVLRVDGGQLIG